VLDVRANRAAQKYTAGEQLRRVAWMLARPLFRLSPRPMFGWRRMLLRAFGARIGTGVHIYNSATIYFPWNLTVAPARTTIASATCRS
jgi:putative colanic acid biosynthesis acetyltransferase WcaF